MKSETSSNDKLKHIFLQTEELEKKITLAKEIVMGRLVSIGEIEKNMDKALEPKYAQKREIETEIELIREDWKKKIQIHNDQIKALGIESMTQEISKLNLDKEILVSQEKGEMSINAVQQVLTKAGIRLHSIREGKSDTDSYFEVRKKFKNGIVMYKDQSYEGMRYFALHNYKLIGFWTKRKTDFIGDYVTSDAWIGTDLKNDNELSELEKQRVLKLLPKKYPNTEETKAKRWSSYHEEYKKEHRFNRDGKMDLTSTHFKNLLDIIKKPETVQAIPINEKSINVLNRIG